VVEQLPGQGEQHVVGAAQGDQGTRVAWERGGATWTPVARFVYERAD